jgi:uncharacterized repeat protein (TIGR01451 family)
MKTSKLLVFGMLAFSLSFATSAVGQPCIADVSCGVEVIRVVDGTLANNDCVQPGDQFYFRIHIGVPGVACNIVDGVVTLELADGRPIYIVDVDANEVQGGDLFYEEVLIDDPYTYQCGDVIPGAELGIIARAHIDCTSVHEDGSTTPSDATGNAKLFCAEPCIEVTKTANTDFSKVGDPVIYTICVTNCSQGDEGCDLTLYNVQVEDPLLGGVLNADGTNFPLDFTLPPGATVCQDFTYVIQEGDPDPLENCVTATGENIDGIPVEDEACATVDLVVADFTVEKLCPPISKVGDEACYEVVITNTGEVCLIILDAIDTMFGPLNDCIGQVICPGESCSQEYCIIVPPDAPDPLLNQASALAEVLELGNLLERASDICEVDLVNPAIDLEKTVEPNEACPGDTVTYTICIENTGDHPLVDVEVNDPLLSPIYGSPLPGFPTELAPGEVNCVSFEYPIPPDANIPTCGEGVFENCAEVIARAEGLPNLRDANDCAEICCPPTPGGEGCTPGFWKNNGDKHGASAWCDRFSPSMKISDVFILDEPLVIRGNGKSTITDPTLLQALGANGGGVNAMIRHGIAAMLNACSDCVQYEYGSEDEVITLIEGALNGDGPYTVDELHSMFAEYNERGCPVNQHGECVGVEVDDGIVIAE